MIQKVKDRTVGCFVFALAILIWLGSLPTLSSAGYVVTAGSTVSAGPSDDSILYLPLITRNEPGVIPIGPDGGSIVAMAAEPGDSGVIYAGAWGGGVFKSLDRGQSWRSASQGLTNLYIQSLAVDPLTPGVVYAGTYTGGVFKSIDGGANWSPTGPGMNDQAIVYTMVIDPQNPDTVYAGTRGPDQIGELWGGGVFKSSDGGAYWQKSNNGLYEDWVYDLAIDPQTPSILYAATHTKGVFISADGAASWSIRNPGLTDWSTRSFVIDPVNPSILFVGTWHGGGVFKTLHSGINWEYSGLANQKIYALTGDALDPETLYAVIYPFGFYKTSDGGNSWGTDHWGNQSIYTILADPAQPNLIYLGTKGAGLYQSIDGGETWYSSQTGLRASQVTAMAVDWSQAMTIYTAVNGAGIFKTIDQGSTWMPVNNGLGDVWVNALALSPQDPQVLVAGTASGGVYLSSDGGASWRTANTGLPHTNVTSGMMLSESPDPAPGYPLTIRNAFRVTDSLDSITIQALHIDAFNPQIMYTGVGVDGLYRSLNGGIFWEATGLMNRPIYSLANDSFDPAILYAGSDQTLPYEDGANTLFKSLDGGMTWQAINAFIKGLTVYAIAPDLITPGNLYIGTNNGVYRSPDGGANWELAGFENQAVAALAFSPAFPNQLYAGTATGLYLSEDGGAIWTLVSDGMLCQEVLSLALAPTAQSSNLVGTQACGIYRLHR